LVEQPIHLQWLNVSQLLHELVELLYAPTLYPQPEEAENANQEKLVKQVINKLETNNYNIN